jgi:hypothetical protein
MEVTYRNVQDQVVRVIAGDDASSSGIQLIVLRVLRGPPSADPAALIIESDIEVISQNISALTFLTVRHPCCCSD